MFECIDKTPAIKGKDEIDLETRYGLLTYGIRFSQDLEPLNQPDKKDEPIIFPRLLGDLM